MFVTLKGPRRLNEDKEASETPYEPRGSAGSKIGREKAEGSSGRCRNSLAFYDSPGTCFSFACQSAENRAICGIYC